MVIQCRGRQFNARRKVQRQRMHRAAIRVTLLFSVLLKMKRAKQEVQRRRRNRAATRIQVINLQNTQFSNRHIAFISPLTYLHHLSPTNPPTL
jgi:hypothetical protein